MLISRLSTRGRTTIPKEIRDQLGLRPGNRLYYTVHDDGSIVIQPANHDVRCLKGMFYKPGRKAVSIEEMNRAIREQALKRL